MENKKDIKQELELKLKQINEQILKFEGLIYESILEKNALQQKLNLLAELKKEEK